MFLENERQNSAFNFEVSDVDVLRRQFEDMERDVPRILAAHGPQGQALVLPAYDRALKASHLFNLMDARGAIAVAERASYIGRIRTLGKGVRRGLRRWPKRRRRRPEPMPQLLLELFSEEIPARMQAGAARDLARMAAERLAAAGLAHEATAHLRGARAG